ncbi:DNA glycosylase [Ramicandelaber brevisporus]|nr:DNA glycosylase [Ramicandelaber brevisporus]
MSCSHGLIDLDQSVTWHDLEVEPAELRLDPTLICGQAFRWKRVSLSNGLPTFVNTLWSRVVYVQQTPTTVLFHGCRYHTSINNSNNDDNDIEELRSHLRAYFQLDTVSLKELYAGWSKVDANFAKLTKPSSKDARSRFDGIRIMQQDPVECLFAFICSANNNISRITNMVNALATNYGTPITKPSDSESTEAVLVGHCFPTVEQLAVDGVEENLRKLGFGYRAKYIADTAKLLVSEHAPSASEWLLSLRSKPYDECRVALQKLVGVGPKVADCICLMSLDKHDAIPVDTHVWQIVVRDYKFKGGSGKTLTVSMHPLIRQALKDVFGVYCGWAQSVLFASDLKSLQENGTKNANDAKDNSAKVTATKKTKAKPVSSQPKSEEKASSNGKRLRQQLDDLSIQPLRRRSPRLAV